jgi:hypothetical protein
MTLEEALAFITVAWNRRDDEVRELRIPAELSNENFPQLREKPSKPAPPRPRGSLAQKAAREPKGE